MLLLRTLAMLFFNLADLIKVFSALRRVPSRFASAYGR